MKATTVWILVLIIGTLSFLYINGQLESRVQHTPNEHGFAAVDAMSVTPACELTTKEEL